ncbi:MAG: radical SAM protein [Candidatus Omnitrophota bacterium]
MVFSSSRNIESLSIDLTNRCNLKCPHCIIPLKQRKTAGAVIKLKKLKRLLPVLLRNKCRHIKFSGGEPMAHTDFKEIYLLVKRAGMGITLFTNGTYLNPEWLNFFRQYPLTRLVVTLYGASDKEYSKNSLSGEKKLFTKICKIIDDLHRTGINYAIQAHVLKNNPDLRNRLAEKLRSSADISMAIAVYPRSAKDTSNVNCALSLEECKAEILEQNRILLNSKGKFLNADPIRMALEKRKSILGCGAGYSKIHITADWRVTPCAFYRNVSFDLGRFSLETIFYKIMPDLFKKNVSPESLCYNCNMVRYCSRCIALGYGSIGTNALREQLCQYAQLMISAAGKNYYD